MTSIIVTNFDLAETEGFPEIMSDVATFHNISCEQHEILEEYYGNKYLAFYSEQYSMSIYARYQHAPDAYEEKNIHGDFIFLELRVDHVPVLFYLFKSIDDKESWQRFIELNLETGEHYIAMSKGSEVVSDFNFEVNGGIIKFEVIGGVKYSTDLRSHYYQDQLSSDIKNLVEYKRWYKYWNNKYGFLESWKDDEQLKGENIILNNYFPYFYSLKGKFILFAYDINELTEDTPRFISLKLDMEHLPEFLVSV